MIKPKELFLMSKSVQQKNQQKNQLKEQRKQKLGKLNKI